MSLGSAVGRADLMRLLERKAGSPLAAGFLGFQPVSQRGKKEKARPEPVGGKDAPESAFARDEHAPEPTAAPPVEDERVQQFLLPVTARTFDPEMKPRRPEETVAAMSDDKLAVPRDVDNPSTPPLAPWSRMARFARSSLGAVRGGGRVDVKRLVRRVASGRPLREIPLVDYLGWAPEAVLVLDEGADMTPFHEDLWAFRDRVIRERGAAGLKRLKSRGAPGLARFEGLAAGASVLAVSDMGQLGGDEPTQARWLRLGAALRRRGLNLSALLPCPRTRWTPELAEIWRCAVWDMRTRLPRERGLRALPVDAAAGSGVDEVLRLLSPATLVEPGLLRRARRLLGARANVAAEFDAWFHEDCWQSSSMFGLRAERREVWLGEFKNGVEQSLKDEAGEWIDRFHRTCAPAIIGEARRRLVWAEAKVDEWKLSETKEDAARMTERMRLVARDPGGEEGRKTGLPRWHVDAVERLPPGARDSRELSEGLALAHGWFKTADIEWPEGIDVTAAEEELKRLTTMPDQQTAWSVWLLGERLRIEPFTEPGKPKKYAGFPLGLMSARRLLFQLEQSGEGDSELLRSVLRRETPGVMEIDLPRLGSLTIGTDCQGLHLAAVKRPQWARRMGYDRFGVYADLEVKGVGFRLRWIPPGRFMMGEGDERHEVTLTMGFWLAETQTTQALWEAVAKTRKTPSRFKGENRPVENVSWEDCQAFCGELENLVPDLSFALPTEAQWEYACRSGTESRFNNGSDDDKAMNELGWFVGNSYVENVHQTHDVKGKASNSWGLYDLHGNVWEWCLDGRRDYRKPAEPDPLGPTEAGARRAVRGGSWYDLAWRSAIRDGLAPDGRDGRRGFRLAAGSKQKSGAVGLWMEGADAPGPWDRDSINRPTRGARPVWAERQLRDRLGRLADFQIEGVWFSFRWIEAGKFLMGSPEDEMGRYGDEGPQHEVEITRGYWMAVTPTTQAQWQAVMDGNPSRFNGPERPVENVSWEDCVAYSSKLNELIPELKAGLPTEAQWEYACRAGTDSAFNDGSRCTDPDGADPALDKLGWYSQNSEMDGDGQTHAVRGKEGNAWGLFDMHGNVGEWCFDGWRTYAEKAVVDPLGPTEAGAGRAVRGGCWISNAGNCRSAIRLEYAPDARLNNRGFRLAAGLELKEREAEPSGERMKGAERP